MLVENQNAIICGLAGRSAAPWPRPSPAKRPPSRCRADPEKLSGGMAQTCAGLWLPHTPLHDKEAPLMGRLVINNAMTINGAFEAPSPEEWLTPA